MKDKPIFYYIDTVYTALCFGWIDSTLEKKMVLDCKSLFQGKKSSH